MQYHDHYGHQANPPQPQHQSPERAGPNMSNERLALIIYNAFSKHNADRGQGEYLGKLNENYDVNLVGWFNFQSVAHYVLRTLPEFPPEAAPKQHPMSEGINFSLAQFCAALGVDMGAVNFAPGDGTLDGDMREAIRSVFRAKFGSDFDKFLATERIRPKSEQTAYDPNNPQVATSANPVPTPPAPEFPPEAAPRPGEQPIRISQQEAQNRNAMGLRVAWNPDVGYVRFASWDTPKQDPAPDPSLAGLPWGGPVHNQQQAPLQPSPGLRAFMPDNKPIPVGMPAPPPSRPVWDGSMPAPGQADKDPDMLFRGADPASQSVSMSDRVGDDNLRQELFHAGNALVRLSKDTQSAIERVNKALNPHMRNHNDG